MKFLWISSFSRTILVWVLWGALSLVLPLLAKAQTNDKGAMVINGQISNQTCVLRVAESSDTLVSNNDYTLSLGTVPVSSADSVTVGNTFGAAKTVYFFSADHIGFSGINTCFAGPVFDVGLTIPTGKILTTNNQTLLMSNGTVATGAVGGVALLLKSKMSTFQADGNFVGDTNLNLTQGSPVGVLLSGNNNLTATLAPTGNNRVFALTTQFVKTSNTVTPGAYSTTIEVNLWWR